MNITRFSRGALGLADFLIGILLIVGSTATGLILVSGRRETEDILAMSILVPLCAGAGIAMLRMGKSLFSREGALSLSWRYFGMACACLFILLGCASYFLTPIGQPFAFLPAIFIVLSIVLLQRTVARARS